MTAVDVRSQLEEKVSLVRNALGTKVPEVVVWITDWEVRF